MNDEIKFACESCGQSVSVSSVHSGASLHCPSCGGSLTVPTVAPSSSSPRTGASEIAFKAESPSQSYGVGDVVLKRYRLERILGRGGMGVVWLAEDEQLNEKVALKFVPPEIKQDKDALKDLRRETQKSRKLSHPNIIRIHDLNQSEGADPFISMEFVEGETMSSLRSKQPNGVFTWEALRPLAMQLGSALDYAHSQGIVHRDLKPANIMVTTSGQLKLADFGIAATISDTMGRVSLDNLSSGTPTYMSPQQIEGFPPSARDDVYALGATLYDLLTTKPPFFRGKIIHQVLNVAPVPLEQRLEELGVTNPVPAEVSAAIMACLVKDSEQRPASAAAVMELLGLGVSSRPVSSPAVGTLSTAQTNEAVQASAPAPAASRPRWLWGAVAGGVAAVVVIIAAVMMSGSKKDSGAGTQPTALPTKEKGSSAGQPLAVSSPTLASTDKVIDLLALVDVKRDSIAGD